MTVASCPSCQESVTVPLDAYPDSIVRCPLCHGEFKLEAFLSQLPPALIVVPLEGHDAEPGDGIQILDVQDAAHAASTETDSPATGAEDEVHEDLPAFDFVAGSANGATDSPIDVSRRQVRRTKSTGWEIAKIVGGALLAIPAAQLILWWFVPGSWKRDLLGIGPPVSRVVPWIVPERFRAPPDRDRDEERLSHSGAAVEIYRPRRPSVPISKTPAPDGEAASPPSQDRMRDEENLDLPTARPGRPEVPQGEQGEDEAAKGRSVAPANHQDEAAGEETSRAADANGARNGASGTNGSSEYDVPALRAAVEAAYQSSVAWDSSLDQSPDHQKELAETFYQSFARLGEVVSFTKPGDPAVRDLATAIRDLLLSFAEQPKKLAMIGNRSDDWLARDARPNRGVFLFGTVKQIRPAGSLFATELDLASRNQRTVTIISRQDPYKFYSPNDRILMLGAIIEHPADNLPGYVGNEQVAVMGGFPVPLTE